MTKRISVKTLAAAAVSVVAHPRPTCQCKIISAAWQRTGPLTADDWEQVRLHPPYTHRVPARPPLLTKLGEIASCHHERLDGTGYHRGLPAPMLPLTARPLAAADAYQAMTEPRAHRAPLPPDRAADQLRAEVSTGRLDPAAPNGYLKMGVSTREAATVFAMQHGLVTWENSRLGAEPRRPNVTSINEGAAR
jgi:HD-GYP domain-containing protein (c-di-GMP phosphodiesterase class II)